MKNRIATGILAKHIVIGNIKNQWITKLMKKPVDHQINEEAAKQESYRQQLVRHARDVYVFFS